MKDCKLISVIENYWQMKSVTEMSYFERNTDPTFLILANFHYSKSSPSKAILPSTNNILTGVFIRNRSATHSKGQFGMPHEEFITASQKVIFIIEIYKTTNKSNFISISEEFSYTVFRCTPVAAEVCLPSQEIKFVLIPWEIENIYDNTRFKYFRKAAV